MDSDLEILDAPAETAAVESAAAEPALAPVAAAEPSAETAAPDATAAPESTPAQPGAIELEYPDEGEEEAAENPEQGESAPDAAGAAPAADAAPSSQRFGTAALTRTLKENPELAAAAESNPRVKAQLYQMARRSQELAEYQDVLPSVNQAREALAARDALGNYDRAFYGTEPETFWQTLYDAQTRVDPATGERKSSGAYERHIQFLQQTFLDGIAARASAGNHDELTDAVAAIREALGWGNNSRSAPHSQAQDGTRRSTANGDELPPQIRQQLQELEQLRSRRSEDEQRAAEQFMDGTADEVGRDIRGFVDGILANASLSAYDKQNIARDFLEEVVRLADSDKVHDAALKEIFEHGGPTPSTRAQMKARVMAWVRQNGRDILEPILKKAGAGLRQRQATRQQAAANVRHEPRATGAPAAPVTPNARDMVSAREKQLGRRLSDREILDLG